MPELAGYSYTSPELTSTEGDQVPAKFPSKPLHGPSLAAGVWSQGIQ